MTHYQFTRLVEALAQLVGVLIWPALVLFILIYFRSGLSDFLGHLSEVSVKAGGAEISAKRQEAAVALGAAIGSRSSAEPSPDVSPDPRQVVHALPSVRAQRRMEGSQILWVDDEPRHNLYERQALEALGLRVDLSTSTEEAVEKVRQKRYDLIISDMGRPGDTRAGYTLLGRLRNSGYSMPFIVYSGSRDPRHVQEAKERGAIGATNYPQELLELVTQAIAGVH